MKNNRYIPIGQILTLGNKKFTCIKRDSGQNLAPRDVCSICDLKYLDCDRVSCCKPDREDGENVIFKMRP